MLCPFCSSPGIGENKAEMECELGVNSLWYACSECKKELLYSAEKNFFLDAYDDKVLDIQYKNAHTAVLSNLYPNQFTIGGLFCESMEGFLRSLTVQDEVQKKELCHLSGLDAWKVRYILPDWREKQILYYNGEKFERSTDENSVNQRILTNAYNALFSCSSLFVMALEKYADKFFIHSIGEEDYRKTLLTPNEYIWQLNRLRKLL